MSDRIIKYIEAHVPCNTCNFACSYCYVRQRTNHVNSITSIKEPKKMQKYFSKKRLGGSALINLCAAGETLLHPDIPDVVNSLLVEGHYVSIVTNGVVTAPLERILNECISTENLFFKCSFHYLELVRTSTLEKYINNIESIRRHGVAFTVELVASDDQIPYINEIKKICIENFGAMPHVTIPRDDRTTGIDVMTSHNMDDYIRIWEAFDSELFRYKVFILHKKQTECCMAGEWTYSIDLGTGAIRQCYSREILGNLYQKVDDPFPKKRVGETCGLPYCYNGHVFYSLGNVKTFPAPTYFEVRDRITRDGCHWISGKMRDVFSQKLFENNEILK